MAKKEETAVQIRSALDISLERRIWALWGYVRDNQNSLDSERACKMIREGFNEAVCEVRNQLDIALNKIERQRLEIKELSAPKPKSKPTAIAAAEAK